MEAIGKSIKINGVIQVQKIIDNFGIEKIQLKYFSRAKNGRSINFSKFQAVYFLPTDWKELKKALRRNK